MVMIKDRIREDMKAAMRSHEAARLSTIRLLLAAIKQREVDERIEADDAVVMQVIAKMVKQRRDSVQQYRAGGREDLASKEQAEIDVLEAYLPAQMSEEEIGRIIEDCFASMEVALGCVCIPELCFYTRILVIFCLALNDLFRAFSFGR